jgi:hypothetical protein
MTGGAVIDHKKTGRLQEAAGSSDSLEKEGFTVTPEYLHKKLDDAEWAARKVLVENLEDEEFLRIAQKGPAFHDLLVRAQHNGWIHYTRLAEELDISASQVNRWFKPSGKKYEASRSTPNKFAIEAALKALSKIIQDDMRLLRRNEPPTGGEIVSQNKQQR